MKWTNLVNRFYKELSSEVKKQPKPPPRSAKLELIEILDTDSVGT